MKRILTAMMMLAVATAAMAQKGLAINQLFGDRYRKDANVTETLVRGQGVEKYSLDLYHSLTFKGREAEAGVIVPLIKADTRNVSDSEESYKDGRLYYGFYALGGKNTNRYILYLNNHVAGGNTIVLLYLEGAAGTRQVKRMLKKK